jgi:hypothetical protein
VVEGVYEEVVVGQAKEVEPVKVTTAQIRVINLIFLAEQAKE